MLLKQMFYDEYKITDTEYLKSLQTEIKNNTIKSLRNRTNVKGQMTYWNYFIDKKIFNKVKDITYKYFWYDAWGNILNKNDYVEEHDHITVNPKIKLPCSHSGILYLTDQEPGTYFKKYDVTIKPELGKIIIFKSNVLHSVKKCDTSKERITLAFNGRRKEAYEFN